MRRRGIDHHLNYLFMSRLGRRVADQPDQRQRSRRRGTRSIHNPLLVCLTVYTRGAVKVVRRLAA